MTPTPPARAHTECPLCGRPRATEHDNETVPDGEGEELCWRDYDTYQCEMRALPEYPRSAVRRLVSAARATCRGIETWEAAVESVIGRQPQTGACTAELRAALAEFPEERDGARLTPDAEEDDD